MQSVIYKVLDISHNNRDSFYPVDSHLHTNISFSYSSNGRSRYRKCKFELCDPDAHSATYTICNSTWRKFYSKLDNSPSITAFAAKKEISKEVI